MDFAKYRKEGSRGLPPLSLPYTSSSPLCTSSSLRHTSSSLKDSLDPQGLLKSLKR